MDAAHYQGLFYLSVGVGSFTSLLLGLRLVGSQWGKAASASSSLDQAAWKGREELELVEVIEETHDIKTFRLRRLGGKKIPHFAPGQFLSFQIGDDQKLLRSYSISNAVHQNQLIQVSIKRLADGKGSGWFHSLSLGSRVWAYPPSGLFTDQKLSAEDERVYIAGGIGITPMLAMIETNLAMGATPPMTLFYGMRTTDDMAFHDLLSYLSARHARLRYIPVLSTPSPAWPGEGGFVTYDFIKSKLAGSLETAHFFLCGPDPMTEGITAALAAHGIEDERVHLEKFASPTAFDREGVPERKAVVLWQGERYLYQGKETLLEFLESQGIDLPFACRVGVCGTCKCLVQGKVEAVTDAGLTAAEKRQGMILPCVAFPLEDLDLSLG